MCVLGVGEEMRHALESVPFFHHVGPKDKTRGVRQVLASLSSLSQLTDPKHILDPKMVAHSLSYQLRWILEELLI